MGIYFRTDVTQLTYAELWRISSRLSGFLNGCARKFFGVVRPPLSATRHDESINEVPLDAVPAAARRVFMPHIDDLEDAGARLAFYHQIHGTANMAGFAAVLLPPEGDATITLTWVRVRIATPGKETSTCVVTSRLEDGTFFSTTNHRRQFNSPPGFMAQRFLRAGPVELLRRHREALAGLASPARSVPDVETAKAQLIDARRVLFDWQVARGVWVPLTPREQVLLGLPLDDEDRP